jgi:YD repeat-containing protein
MGCPKVPSDETAFVLDSNGQTCSRPGTASKNLGGCSVSQQTDCTNPINTGTGNKYQHEMDYVIAGHSRLNLARTYNSSVAANSSLGAKWRGAYSQALIYRTNGAISTVTLKRTDNKQYFYNLLGSAWIPDRDVVGHLTQLFDNSVTPSIPFGWNYTNADDEVETYNVAGRLTSIADRAGVTQTLAYDGSGRLISVTDHAGRTLTFTYDTSNRISTMTNPAGGVYTYTYDANNNLKTVTYPDTKGKTYLYENATFKNALTGIIDENNSRYMTYTYDAQGRAIDEISPVAGTNVNHYSLNFNPSGLSTTVTDPRGSVRTYNFTTILGVVKSTGQSQPAGAGCAASAASLTYDANGNVSSRTDFNGNKTTYGYDLARNLETSRTEGLTSAGAAVAGVTRTVTTAWHPTWRLPTMIEEYAGATATGTPVKRTSYTYDTKGNLTTQTEGDPVRSLDRTTTITYTYSSAVPGLVLSKVIDGPRTDVSDITTYTYYPHDASCTASTSTSTATNLGCRGQLQSVTNAAGQTTQYTRYNHHGQVEEMIDANGLVTTSTYDLRQRLLSKTVGTETTTLQYDGVGQVTLLTMPDNSTLGYTYDAAHRLTKVTDGLNNSISYTLDAEGNRINEEVKDPSGNLTKTLTRSYDALNRLQQLTGVGVE